jgi:hypothetical protein
MAERKSLAIQGFYNYEAARSGTRVIVRARSLIEALSVGLSDRRPMFIRSFEGSGSPEVQNRHALHGTVAGAIVLRVTTKPHKGNCGFEHFGTVYRQ